MSAPLTVLIPCKDERLNIEACIESARKVADEVLVADSGSTDGTLEIVRQMGGCRVIEREFVNFADFKNWAIPQARHPWVLIVDSDERVTNELATEIRTLLADPPEQIDGYLVPRRAFFMGREIRHSGWGGDLVCRLIRRDRCRYHACRVHEKIDRDSRRLGKLRHSLLHFSTRSYDQYFEKYVKYTQWGAQDQWERGRRTSFNGLLIRPFFRFLQLYVLRLGFLDGMAGVQVCMLQSFFITFMKQARLWEMEQLAADQQAGY